MQSFPPFISDYGKLYLPKAKSGLLKCIEVEHLQESPTVYDCLILDGAVVAPN